MNLERTFQEWQANRVRNSGQALAALTSAAQEMEHADTESVKWMSAGLTDDQRKFFVAALCLEAKQMPEALYEPMIRAAVYEPSPMIAQAFVEPCVKAFGSARIIQTLVDYLEKGDDYEKTGAVNAMHWATERKTTTDSGRHRVLDAQLMSLLDYRRTLYLETFVKNTDLDLRRAIITHADLDTLGVPIPLQELIDKVTKIARAHPDEYIRHRLEVQLGRVASAYTLPQRKRPETTTVPKKSWWKQLWR